MNARRSLLIGLFGVFFCGPLSAAVPDGTAAPWPRVPPTDLASLKPSDFTDDELDLPYYVVHFHHLANSVVEKGDNRGYIKIQVWRSPRDNEPYNVRIMESILSLAYFYTTKRPWNPYYGSPAVRVRIEAALDFWCRKQFVDGRFPEYGSGEWNLAATAFATKFVGEALALLHGGPPIDPAIFERALAADRKAIEAVLDLPEMREHGKDFSNQFTNVYAGGLVYLSLRPDAGLAEKLARAIRENTHEFQSPAGYFYEQKGPDFNYNLGTHQSNTRMALHYTRGTDLGRVLLDEEQRFLEWIAYNAALEPDGQSFTLNRGIETRQRARVLRRRSSLPREIPLSAAFQLTDREAKAEDARNRAELVRRWPAVRDFAPGFSGFSPYTFLHLRHDQWWPTAAEQAAALASLPYLQRDRFIHQRMDSRQPLTFTYVRRPRYYAAFNSGRQLMEQQRYGLGLLWTRGTGALLQTQTGTHDAAWGTRAPGSIDVYEAGDLHAEMRVGDALVSPQPGTRDLAEGVLSVSYPLGGRGTKELTFGEAGVAITVAHAGAFEEQIPLLLGPGDELVPDDGRVTLRHDGRPVLVLSFDGGQTPRLAPFELATEDGKPITVVTIPAADRLRYTLELAAAE